MQQQLEMENRIQLTTEEIIMGFVASCIEDVADALGLDYLEVYQRMNAVKMIDEYIIPSYEVLHCESRKNVTEGLIDTLKRWEGSEIAILEISDNDRAMSEEQHRKVRNIIRWQRIGCIVVKISETLKVSLKEALDLSRRKTEWNDKQSYDTVINTTEHFLLALPHSKG